MKFNKRSLAAGVAGVSTAAVLLGGSTLALWQDSVSLDGGTITAGNLDVAALNNSAWQDISTDVVGNNGVAMASVAGNGKNIDIANYKIVPGDTVSKSQDLDVALQGDNMKATLSLTGAQLSGILGDGSAQDVDLTETGGTQDVTSTEGVTITYTLRDEAGNVVEDESGDPLENVVPGTARVIDLLPSDVSVTTEGTKDYNVTVKAHFANSTPERTRVQAQTALATMGITLAQAR